MDFIKAIILGIIEGFTEFLPVSSTGHLILAGNFLNLSSKEFQNAFNVIIQLGAILAIVVIYFNSLNPLGKNKLERKLKRPLEGLTFKEKLALADKKTLRLWTKIIIGFFPAGVLGFLFDDLIDKYLFNNITVAISLIFYGIVIILIEKKDKSGKYTSIDRLPIKTVILIGFFQCLAMIPGTSRSAATIIGGVLLGADRITAGKFSFYLAIPTMLGATFLKIIKIGLGMSLGQWLIILVGFIVSFLVAMIVVKKFLSYIKKHDFKIFDIYRIILGILVIALELFTK